MVVERLPVDAATCTVLGTVYKQNSPCWTGLDMARAEPRTQATIWLVTLGSEVAPRDVHLDVPWCHPDDQTGSPEDFDCRYRVRPRMQPGGRWKGRKVVGVDFEKWDGKWWLAVVFARAKPPHPQEEDRRTG